MTRRSLLQAALARRRWADARLGVFVQSATDTDAVRRSFDRALAAGFNRVQLQFAWATATADFLKALPAIRRAAGVQVDVLGVYVNCANPPRAFMQARAEDLPRAIELAPELGSPVLAAWTGGFGPDLMTPHPDNNRPAAEMAIVRFLEPYAQRLEAARLRLALETYITLVAPDAPALARLLARLPASIGAVLDPPNLTPVARYAQRDRVLREACRRLAKRTAVVHLKDFRLNASGDGYELPGPLKGELNYPLYASEISRLSAEAPLIVEHIAPADFKATREALLAVFRAAWK